MIKDAVGEKWALKFKSYTSKYPRSKKTPLGLRVSQICASACSMRAHMPQILAFAAVGLTQLTGNAHLQSGQIKFV